MCVCVEISQQTEGTFGTSSFELSRCPSRSSAAASEPKALQAVQEEPGELASLSLESAAQCTSLGHPLSRLNSSA